MPEPTHIIRIEDILAMPSLGLTILAGQHGTPREVLWAHSCELQEPEQWLGPHELLMTVGLCVPEAPDAQSRFIARLDEAGLAGLIVGDHEPLPELSQPMFQEANRRGFPVMLASDSVPYAVIARHVAAANSSQHILQVVMLSKVYRLAGAVPEKSPDQLLTELSNLLRVGLQVTDDLTGLVVAASKEYGSTELQPGARQLSLNDATEATLHISEYPGETLDSFLLVHIVQLLDVVVERTATTRKQQINESSDALTSIMADERTPLFDRLLYDYPEAHGYHLVATSDSDQPVLARAVAMTELPVLVGSGRFQTLVLVPTAVADEFRALVEQLEIGCGVSSVFNDYRDIRIAADEAVRVYSTRTDATQSWAEFEGSSVALFVRSRHESKDIIHTVLGSLAQDSPASRKLRETLFAFLTRDRRWQDTADYLGIHRQTLSYRLNRIAEETGMTLTKSSDLSAFWIAYQAWLNLYGESS